MAARSSRILILFLMWIILGCKSEKPKDDIADYQVIADKICDCCQPLIEANLRMLESSSAAEFTGQMKEMAAIAESSLFCSSTTVPRNQRNSIDFQVLRIELSKNCSLPEKLLNDIELTLKGKL